MRKSLRAGMAAAGTVGLLAAPIAMTNATAAPYTDDAILYISTTNPELEAALHLFGSGFIPFEIVKITINAPGLGLVTVRVGPEGTFNESAVMPEGYACEHKLKAKGKESGAVAKAPVTIGDADAC